MHILHVRSAALAAWLLTACLGCARSGPDEFGSYQQLEAPAPSKERDPAAGAAPSPGAEGAAKPPAADSRGATQSSTIDVGGEGANVVAVAEVPAAWMLVDNGERTGKPSIADENDGVAVAELPETVSVVAASPRKVELLIPEKTFRKAAGAVQMTFDDIDLLKVLNMEPVTADAPRLMPGWLKGLDGQKIRVRGFMYPAYSDELTKFVLARDNQICCFGRNPKIYDLIEVAMRDGTMTHYIENRPFDVVGVFRIKPTVDSDRLLQLYFIDDAVVIER